MIEQRGKVIDLYYAAARLAFQSVNDIGEPVRQRAMAFLANENLLRRGYPATIRVINIRMGNMK